MRVVIDIPDNDYKFIKDLQSLIIGGRGNCKNIQYNVINAIKNGTPYEERPTGKWIIDGHHIRCNRCTHYICNTDREGNEIPDNFCPNCGAKMIKEDPNE